MRNTQSSGELKKQVRGFTLTEIMISLSVLGLVTAISVPMFTRVKIGANEAAARKALATYRDGFINFQMDSGTLAYPGAFNELVGYVDDRLASNFATQTGYRFELVNSDAATYEIRATPITQGVTGVNTFVITEAGTVAEQIAGGLPLPGGNTLVVPPMEQQEINHRDQIIANLFSNSTITQDWLEYNFNHIITQSLRRATLYQCWNKCADGVPSIIPSELITIQPNDVPKFQELFKAAQQTLEAAGHSTYIVVHEQVPDVSGIAKTWPNGYDGPSYDQLNAIEIGIQVSEPITDPDKATDLQLDLLAALEG